jgi:hypothetical protein
VAYLLKARTVEPEKQPLLESGSGTMFVSWQRLGKHVPMATDMLATIEVLLEMVFSAESMHGCYKEDNWGNQVCSVREAVKERDSWKKVGRDPPFREDLSVEAEESSLLKAVTREQLVKTQQAGKGLVGAVVICKVWRSVVAL